MFARTLIFLLCIASACFLYYWQQYSVKSAVAEAEKQRILTYAIGEIDPRFQLSKDEVAALAYQATQIWEKGIGQPLFRYDPQAHLKIHLIYDERQESSKYIDKFNANMDVQAKELDNIAQRLDEQYKQLDAQKKQLEQQSQSLQRELAAWHRLEFEDGENLRRLRHQQTELKQKNRDWSDAREVYFMNQRLYNQRVEDYNIQVRKGKEFNQNNPSRSFHKGTYSGSAIHVYQFSNRDDLKVTLAHEFGHALGLSHHQDPKALMYPFMSAQNLENFTLLPADLELFSQRNKAH